MIRPKDRKQAAATVSAVALLVLVAGCAGESTSSESGSTSPGSTATAGATGASTEEGLYVVQSAGAATLGPVGADGTAELVLADAPERSVYFTSAQDPRAGGASTATVIETLNEAGPGHDAALTWQSPSQSGTLVVTLEGGAYNAGARTLTYTVRPIAPDDSVSSAVVAHARAGGGDEPTTSIPGGVTDATLFIDPILGNPFAPNCNLTVRNESSVYLDVTGVAVDGDGEGMLDWNSQLIKGQVIPPYGTATATSGDSIYDCHADLTFGLDLASGPVSVALSFEDAIFDPNSWSCTADTGATCTVDANASGQPMNIEVIISE